MKNVGLLVALVLVAVVLGAVTVGALYWYSEQRAEQKLQYYIGRLEKNGYTVEECSLSDFDVDDLRKSIFWADFTQVAYFEGADRIYFDRKMHILYFLKADENGVNAYVFYYKRILWD